MSIVSRLRARLQSSEDDRPPAGLHLPLIPSLIGVLAAVGVASVILALLD